MTKDEEKNRRGPAFAIRYELAPQTVPGGGALSLTAWDSRGGAIRAEKDTGLDLSAGHYLALFTGETEDAGAALALNGARISYLEAMPREGARRLTLQGLISLTGPGTLCVVNNAETPKSYGQAVLTVIRLL